ncbi:MAG: hypothetical protein EBZ49_16265 [Proteobacteria bacterium]|nr:hypothetical protein [Pseudomonadota bacterium]
MAGLNFTVGSRFRQNTIKQQTANGTAAVLSPLVLGDAVKNAEQIFVQALSTNTGRITIGTSSSVTAGGAGIELVAGANTVLPSHISTDWYVIASAAGQVLNIVYSSGAY